MVKIVEQQVREQSARLAVLRGETLDAREIAALGKEVVGWLAQFRELCPEVPANMMVPSGSYSAENLP